jgi:mutator protein MutT
MTAVEPEQLSPRPRIRRGVVGVVRQDRQLLLIRRAFNVSKGGCWCFPGGHVEPGETPRNAVQRELREELGLEVIPLRRFGAVRVLDTRHILAVWRVELIGGALRPDPREIADVRWLTAAAVRALRPSLPSNERVLELLGL